jgi:hypothetical protein
MNTLSGDSFEFIPMDWNSFDTICGGSRKDHGPVYPNAQLDLSTSASGKRDIETDGGGWCSVLSSGYHYSGLYRDGLGPPELYGF